MKLKIKQFCICFLLFFVFLIINSLLDELFSFTKYSSFVSSLLSLFLLLYYFRTYIKNDIKNIAKINKEKWISYTLVFFICYISVVIFNFFISIYVGNTATNEQLIEAQIFKNPFINFFEVVLITPFIEEIICRLNFRKLLKNKWIFSIFTGLFFASLHILVASSITELLFIIPYFIMGFYLGYVYIDSNSIFTSIIYHLLNNLIAYILLLIGS